jgi:IS1 family transposase
VRKETGELAPIERWFNLCGSGLARYVRKTLSFSKSEQYHALVIRWFIVIHNLSLNL